MYLNKQISENSYKYLLKGGNGTSVFYMLPKIHKNLVNPPGHPIVSSVDCATEKISQLIDIILRPYAQNGDSFIKDTPHLLRKLNGITLADDKWLFTMDVQALYTNIPHIEGIKCIQECL